MFGDGPLTFQEFITREPVPLARVHDAVLGFLRTRTDAVLCGAHAVNAYVKVSRMTQDVDLASTRAAALAVELQRFLSHRFKMNLRIGEIRNGQGYRIVQKRRQAHRHLVDLWAIEELPPTQRVRKVLVIAPVDLIVHKMTTMIGRRGRPKAMTDKADIYRLLLAFPELKKLQGPVTACLRALGAAKDVQAAWKELVAQNIEPEDDDDKFLG